MDMTSSAGDWTGFFIQQTGKNSAVAIGFEQVNNYPKDGFTLYTAEYPFYKGKLKDPDFLKNARNAYMNILD